MGPKSRVISTLFITGALFVAAPVRAAGQQAPMGAPPAAIPPVSPLRDFIGHRVVVTGTDGRTLKGRLGRVSDTDILLRITSGDILVNLADIRRIDTVSDAVTNGIVIGGLLGAAVGSLYVKISGGINADLANSFARQCKPPTCTITGGVVKGSDYLGPGLGGLAIGAAAGLLIDASAGRSRTVYERAGALSARVVPFVTPRTIGLGGSVRW